MPHILWVQNGTTRSLGRHGSQAWRETWTEREIVFLRVGDELTLRAREEETWVGQVSISGEALVSLVQTYPELKGQYFWKKSSSPARLRLTLQEMGDFSRRVRDLQTAPQTTLSIHAFLFPLLIKAQAVRFQLGPDAPDWLCKALEVLETPEVYRAGAAGLVAATGRSHAYVSRTVRKHLACSPSDLVNMVRAREAARLLSTNRDSLSEVAGMVGITNLSYFHRLFLKHHGISPAAYRAHHGYGSVQPL